MRRRDKNRLNDALTVRIASADLDQLEEIAIERRESIASVARNFIADGLRRSTQG